MDFFQGNQLAGLAVAAFENLANKRMSVRSNGFSVNNAGRVGIVRWHRSLRRARRTLISACRFVRSGKEKKDLLQLLERTGVSFVHAVGYISALG